MNRYFIIYKPFGMLSQFTKEGEHKTLADLDFNPPAGRAGFPKDVYPVGRLDSDSEGLLLLTNDRSINHKLLDPKFKHNRTYLAQVEGTFTEEAKRKLERGVEISVDGKKYQTLPCKVEIVPEPKLPERDPPIRYRKNIPTSFIKIALHEGKNRQVRKMTAAAGFPTLRLIRTAIENIQLENLMPGETKEMQTVNVFQLLNIG